MRANDTFAFEDMKMSVPILYSPNSTLSDDTEEHNRPPADHCEPTTKWPVYHLPFSLLPHHMISRHNNKFRFPRRGYFAPTLLNTRITKLSHRAFLIFPNLIL